MLTSPQIVEWLADSYRAAALAGAEMTTATAALESIRKALSSLTDAHQALAQINDQVGRADAPLAPVLTAFRSRFRDSVVQATLARVHEALATDPEEGWTQWLRSYAAALCPWQNFVAIAICRESFPFSGEHEKQSATIKLGTKYVHHERWGDTVEVFDLLGHHPLLTAEQRARFLVRGAQVELYHLQRLGRAKKLIDEAMSLGPDEAEVCCVQGQYFMDQKQFDQAKTFLDRAIQLDPHFAEGYAYRGDWAEKQGDLAAAEDWYRKTVSAVSGSTLGYDRLLHHYGRRELFVKHEDRLSEFIERILLLNPLQEYTVYLDVAGIYRDNDRYEEAHRWIQRSMAFDPELPNAFCEQGITYIQLKAYEPAQEALQKAIALDRGYFGSYWCMDWLFEEQQKWEDAIAWCRECLPRRPAFAHAVRVRIGSILKQHLKRYAEAETEFLAALKEDPDNQNTVSWLHDLAITYYDQEQDFDAARRVYDAILRHRGEDYRAEYDGQNAILLNVQGNAHYSRADYATAAEFYRQAAARNPSDAVYHSNVALALELARPPHNRLALLDEAIASLTVAIELAPKSEDYAKRRESLIYKKNFAARYDETCLDMRSVALPLALEVATDLLPFMVDSSNRLVPEVQELVSDARKWVEAASGVVLPGVTFRYDEGAAAGAYTVKVWEMPMRQGTLVAAERFFPGERSQLEALGIRGKNALHPLTGATIFTVSQQDADKLQSAGHSVWHMLAYPVYDLAAVTLKNLKLLLDHYATVGLLQKDRNDTSELILKDPEMLSSLVRVLRGLVAEQAPISEFGAICTAFFRLKQEGASHARIVEELRSLPDLQRRLRGNVPDYRFLRLGKRLSAKFQGAVWRKDGEPLLAMTPMITQDVLHAVRDAVQELRGGIAVIVDDPEIRPFVRRVIELEFPDVAVLSAREWLPELSSSPAGEIELSPPTKARRHAVK